MQQQKHGEHIDTGKKRTCSASLVFFLNAPSHFIDVHVFVILINNKRIYHFIFRFEGS